MGSGQGRLGEEALEMGLEGWVGLRHDSDSGAGSSGRSSSRSKHMGSASAKPRSTE